MSLSRKTAIFLFESSRKVKSNLPAREGKNKIIIVAFNAVFGDLISNVRFDAVLINRPD